LTTKFDPTKHNTIVVSAKPEGFENAFLNKSRWWDALGDFGNFPIVRNNAKWLAIYQTKPIGCITYIARIQSWRKMNNRYRAVLDNRMRLLDPIPGSSAKKDVIRNFRYTTLDKILGASSTKDLWG